MLDFSWAKYQYTAVLGTHTYILNEMFWSLSRGPDGVGVNELKRRLLISDPDRYGVIVPRKTHIDMNLPHTQCFLIFLKAVVPVLLQTPHVTREGRRTRGWIITSYRYTCSKRIFSITGNHTHSSPPPFLLRAGDHFMLSVLCPCL